MSINIPGTSIAQYIVELAALHNVVYVNTAGVALTDFPKSNWFREV